jgi:hypothetical protein
MYVIPELLRLIGFRHNIFLWLKILSEKTICFPLFGVDLINDVKNIFTYLQIIYTKSPAICQRPVLIMNFSRKKTQKFMASGGCEGRRVVVLAEGSSVGVRGWWCLRRVVGSTEGDGAGGGCWGWQRVAPLAKEGGRK